MTVVCKEKERTGIVRHSTRVTGSLSYGAVLPSAIDETAVTATMADGVLTITMPEAKGASSRRIAIYMNHLTRDDLYDEAGASSARAASSTTPTPG